MPTPVRDPDKLGPVSAMMDVGAYAQMPYRVALAADGNPILAFWRFLCPASAATGGAADMKKPIGQIGQATCKRENKSTRSEVAQKR